MIVVDSSVWIDHFRDVRTAAVGKLRSAEPLSLLLGDLVLLELLRGARDDRHALAIERGLSGLPRAGMLDEALARAAAGNYRVLRSLGITPRRTADLIIGTFCISHHHHLLHDDRDFDAMHRHLGLRVA